jgi:hypothetical protein
MEVYKMEYGEELFAGTWHSRFSGKYYYFRFRVDPVPTIGRQGYRFRHWYKFPKSYQEKRLWFASEGYGRLKRSPLNLPCAYDDYQRGDVSTRRSWKNRKIKKQWMKNVY